MSGNHILHKLSDPLSGPSKIRQKIDHLASDLSRLKTAVQTTYNPQHRHDEAWEKEMDAKMMAMREEHRFLSFAPERTGNMVKYHIDGHDYFWAISIMIDQAKTSIFILDWWLTPELHLRRPPADHPEWRLDRLLKRKAEEGVRIYIMVYKEVTASMTMNSKHTKHALENLHENILVMRHPDHSGNELVYYWSHHEKLVVVDNKYAGMGGLDLCFGRFDTHDHALADVHPTEWDRTIFPGQDYNNARIMDFQSVDKFVSNTIDISQTVRMPWHDVSLTLTGPSVVDLVQHFVERWNFVKEFKYKHDHHFEWLALPSPWGDVAAEKRQRNEARREARSQEHPHLAKWAQVGRVFAHPYHWPPSEQPRAMEPCPQGHASVQVLRSAADWSHGVLIEDSIQQAYISLIREANHTIYLENQFFITATQQLKPVTNQIGAALAQRVISAARDGREFKIIIVIPAVPAFAGDIQSQAGLKAIMEAQYRSINRGGESIFEVIRQAGYDPEPYISFWNLRGYDRINFPWDAIQRMEKNSGVTFHEAQVAQARIWLGDEDKGTGKETVTIEVPREETGKMEQHGKKDTVKEGIPVPRTVEEAQAILTKFENGAEKDDRNVLDNICHNAFQGTNGIAAEQWNGTEQEERDCFVSEIIYIHSKLMIVDDRRIIIGSSNLNDRSQRGDRDSEIAIVIEDEENIETKMDGKNYMASKLATEWRRSLMREHLGLQDWQPAFNPKTDPRPSMQPVTVPQEYVFGTPEDQAVEDVLSPAFWRLWSETGINNRLAFEKVFRPIPNNAIRTWQQYVEYLQPSKGVTPGHVANPDLSLKEIKEILGTIRGHLVDMPLDFLMDVKELNSGDIASVNSYTLPVFL